MSMSWSLCLVALVCMVVDASTLRPSQKLQYSIHKSTKLFRPVRTLLIDNFDSYTYNIWQLLAEINGIEPYVVHNNAFGGDWDVLMSQIPLFDNIVLSPGPGSPDREEDFGLCLDAICRSTVPLLGICLGHQGLAHAYGGRVSKARTPMHGRISRINSVRNSELFSNIEQDAEVVRYHSLIVDKLPADLRATAWTSLSSASNMDDDNDPIIMALEHVSRPQYGVQFHPESVRTPLGRQLLSNFRDITKRHRKDDNYGRSIDESMMNNSYEGSSSSQRPVTVTHYSSPTIKYEEYLLTGHTAGYGRGHGLKQEEDRSSIKSNVRYVHVTSIPLDASNDVTTEEVFEALYSNCSAAFWLDSQSPLRSSFTLQATASSSGSDGDENHPHSNTSRLSYMGALDTDYSSAVEYHNHHQLLQRHVGADGIHGHSSVLNTSIFQFLRDKFNEESETDTQIDRFMRRSFINNHVTSINNHVPSTQSKLPFEITGAFFGYLGYEVGHEAINILTGTSSSSHPSAGCYDLSTPSHPSAVFGRDMNADEDSSTPLALLLYPSRYIVYDHESSTYHTVSFVESSSRGGNSSRNNSNDNNNNNNNNTFLQEEATRLGEELADRLEAIIGLKRTSCEELKGRSTKATDAAVAVAEQSSRLVAWKSKAAYKNDIATCLENIASGETYEVCLTLQFTGPLRQLHTTDRSTRSRYIDTYKDLRKYNPAPYACFIQYKSPRIRVGASDDHRSVAMPVDANSFAICCTSPECFLKLTPVSHRYHLHHHHHHPSQSRHTVLSHTL